MKTIVHVLVFTLVPAAVFAQVSGQAQSRMQSAATVQSRQAAVSTSATAQANAEVRIPTEFSADARAKLEAMYVDASMHHVPTGPMSQRVAEGQAKGATETATIASAGRVKANMESAQSVMIEAHRRPSDEEVERGAYAMERGVTVVQIRALCAHTPRDRSLVVAFDVLAKLSDGGMPMTQAVAQVQSKLDVRASDASIAALAANVGGAASIGLGGINAAVGATGTVNAAAKGTGSVTGSVTGAVVGAVKKS